jgi:hypothetical protein
VRFDLVHNALDSLVHAVTHLTANENKPSPGDLKVAVLGVTHAVELLVKERLRRVDPSSLFEDTPAGSSRPRLTVSPGAAVHQLGQLGDVWLSPETAQDIRRSFGLRNRIQHYEFDMSPAQTTAVLGRLVAFLIDFSKRHLELDLEAELPPLDWVWLQGNTDFWVRHADLAAARLKEEVGAEDVIDCPMCCWDTYSLSRRECVLCSYEGEPEPCPRCGVWTHTLFEDFGLRVCYTCLWNVTLRVRFARTRPDGVTELAAADLPGSEVLALYDLGWVLHAEVIAPDGTDEACPAGLD